MSLPPVDGSSFDLVSLRAIEVFSRPPVPVHSLILASGLCRLGMGVFLALGASSRCLLPQKGCCAGVATRTSIYLHGYCASVS